VAKQDFRVIDALPPSIRLSETRVRGRTRTAAMLLGDFVTYEGRRYVVVGVSPISVKPFSVQLSDPDTDRTIWVEWPSEPVERAALRLVEEEKASE
jgi:hypothetical protein